MIKDIQKIQQELESKFFAFQPTIEKIASELYQSDPELASQFLTDYSLGQAEQVVKRWRQLGEFLLMKYNDGYVKDEKGRPQGVGYPSSWLQQVLKVKPKQFKLPQWDKKKK